MRIYTHKILATIKSEPLLLLPPIPITKHKQPSLSKIREVLQLQEPTFYKQVQNLIETYIKRAQTFQTKSLDENLLWQIAFRDRNLQLLKSLLCNEQKILSIFKNPQNLFYFNSPKNLSTFLDIFCIDHNRLTLLKQFSPTQLYKIINTKGSKQVLSILLDTKNWETLTETYKMDSSNITKIASIHGAKKVFDCLLNFENWKTLTETNKLDCESIVKIASRIGAKPTFDILLDPHKWKTLTEKRPFDLDVIIKIASNDSASNILSIFTHSASWNRLTKIYKFDTLTILRIANNHGARSVFNCLLDSKNWKTLTEIYKFDRDSIAKIAISAGAKPTLDILLDPHKWKILTEVRQFDLDVIIKIAKNDSSSTILNNLIDSDSWNRLTKTYYFDIPTIIKIATDHGARNIFNCLLNFENWKKLTEVCGLDSASILKIANRNGSRYVFDILLNPKKWKILTNVLKIDIVSIVKIASSTGARKVLEMFFNQKKWKTLTQVYKFDSNSIIKIASNNCANGTFDILLNPSYWNRLSKVYKLDSSSIIKIANNDGASKVFDILLDPDNWKTLTEIYHFDSNSITKIASNTGASNVLKILLDPKKWKTLTEIYNFDHATIIKIASSQGIRNTLDILLDPNNWKTLTETYHFNLKDIEKITSHSGSKMVLNILLDPKKWHILTQNIGLDIDTLISITNQHNASQVLETLLNPDKYSRLSSIFGKKLLLKLASTRKISAHLDALLKLDKRLKPYFDDHWRKKILTLPVKDQQGLLTICTSPLKQELHFSQKEMYILAKLCGKHLPHIFNLIIFNTDEINAIFSEYSPALSPLYISNKSHAFNSLKNKDFRVLMLVEFHHFFSPTPLSLQDLHFLQKILQSRSSRFLVLKRLAFFSTKASQTNRLSIWKTLFKRNWFKSDTWIRRLAQLPHYLRHWFILEGYDHILSIFTQPSPPDTLSSIDQEFLINCLKSPIFRTYIQQNFDNAATTLSRDFLKHNCTLLETENGSQLLATKPQQLTISDCIRLTIMTYSIIDTEITLYNKLDTTSPSTVKNHFSAHDILAFKNSYPIFLFHEGIISSSLSKHQLTAILELPYPSISVKDRKRTSNTPPPLPIKKQCTSPPQNTVPSEQLLPDSDEWTLNSEFLCLDQEKNQDPMLPTFSLNDDQDFFDLLTSESLFKKDLSPLITN